MKKKITQFLLAALCLAVVTALVTSGQMAFAGTPEQNRAVGFSDACNGVPLTGHHTPSYLEGYNQGKAQCNNNGQITGAPDRSNNAGSSSSSSSQSSGNTLNIHIGK